MIGGLRIQWRAFTQKSGNPERIVRQTVTLDQRVGQTIAGNPSGLREESPGSPGQDGR